MKDPYSRRSHAILEDLTAYSEMQRADIWLNEFALAEVKIIELCVKKANQFRADHANGTGGRRSEDPLVNRLPLGGSDERIFAAINNSPTSPNTDFGAETAPGLPNLAAGGGPFQWQVPWADPSFSLFEPIDLQQWENVLDTITQDQILFGL